MTLYRIKPLVWHDFSETHATASVPFASFDVRPAFKGDGDGMLVYLSVGDMIEPIAECDSIEHGKQLAEQHWLERLESVLEPVDEEIIFELNANQHNRNLHPYTCGNDSNHRPLIATADGWRCADCDYRQEYR